ncbi:MAG: hypothetical protein ACR2HO_10935 [Rubrobacteraceae bacterium]|nr:hypothetical protein [Rubrobacter sp.]
MGGLEAVLEQSLDGHGISPTRVVLVKRLGWGTMYGAVYRVVSRRAPGAAP